MGLLIALFMMFLVVAIAAIILRVACGIVGVEQTPDLGRAMIIVLGNVLALIGLSIVLGLVGLGGATQSTLVSALLSAKVYETMLPTSFGRGFLIWLAQFIIVAILGFITMMMFGGMLMAMFMAHH